MKLYFAGPRWASWNLGIFLCIRCAGIHRNLGVHISKVKSVNLDTWTPEQVVVCSRHMIHSFLTKDDFVYLLTVNFHIKTIKNVYYINSSILK